MTIEEDYNKRKKKLEDAEYLKRLCEEQETKIRIIKDMLKEVLKYINSDIYSKSRALPNSEGNKK